MSKPNRTIVIAALLAAAAAWPSLANAQLHDTHAAKLSAVRDHLAGSSQQADWAELARACERAVALQGVVIDSEADSLRIELDLTGTAPYRLRFDDSSNELYIDIARAIVLPNAQSLLLDAGGLVNGIRTELRSTSPALISRATLALTSPVAVTASFEGNKLIVNAERADSFSQPASEALARESAVLQALLDGSGYTSVTAAREDCAARTNELATAIADTRVRLLEHDFAGLTGGDEKSGAPSTLVDQIDMLSGELERLSAAQSKTLAEREELRTAALRTRELSTSDAFASPDAAFLMTALFDTTAAQISAMEETAAQRLLTIAEAAAGRVRAVRELTQDAAILGASDDSTALFASLDGALGEVRGHVPAVDTLASFDEEMTQINVSEASFDLDTPMLAAVKKDALTGSAAASIAPEKRSTIVESPETSPAALGAGFSSISVVDSAGEPIRLAQNMDTREDISFSAPRAQAFQLFRPGVPADQDPLQQPVTIDFRDMDLLNVVSLLAEKGEINVIAGTEVRGTVTASLQDIPLGQAIETILRMNGLGIIEESGVYRITTYEEAIESHRETKIIFLQNTEAEQIEQTIDQAVKGPDASRFQASANEDTNTIVLSGPADLVAQMSAVVQKLDVTEQTIPTVTKVFKLNHAVPDDLEKIVEDILTDEGEVNGDFRSRQLVVTDTPGNIRDIEDLVGQLDGAVKQVAIEATVVDVVMDDNAQTGVDWLIERLADGNIQSGSISGQFPVVAAADAALSLLTGDFNIDLLITGEVRSNNAEILANPVVVTVENSPARITIAEEVPFRDDLQTEAGGTVSSTEFKEIGTILEVTPRITHENEIVVSLLVKQSSITGFTPAPENIPIEDLREVESTLRISDGQTVFIGGLRKFQDSVSARKMPILGDIPVVGFFFGNRSVVEDHVELLVFLTCNVLAPQLPELTPYQQEWYDEVGGREMRPNGTRTLVDSYVDPEIYRDPFYKWRRDK